MRHNQVKNDYASNDERSQYSQNKAEEQVSRFSVRKISSTINTPCFILLGYHTCFPMNYLSFFKLFILISI